MMHHVAPHGQRKREQFRPRIHEHHLQPQIFPTVDNIYTPLLTLFPSPYPSPLLNWDQPHELLLGVAPLEAYELQRLVFDSF